MKKIQTQNDEKDAKCSNTFNEARGKANLMINFVLTQSYRYIMFYTILE